MPKVSVIIPIYNVEKYLARCLDSVCNQTLKEIEIICIDDCSTDNSFEILQKYSARDVRLKIISFNTNQGVAVARNAGLKIAQGEYLGFVDSDDYIDLDFYEKLYKKGKKESSEIVKANFLRLNLDGTTRASGLNKIINEKNKFYFTYEWSTAIYKKSLLINHTIKFPEDILKAEDIVFLNRCILHCNTLSIIDDTFYHYIRRENSLDSKMLSLKYLKSTIHALCLIDAERKEHHLPKNNIETYISLFYQILTSIIFRINRIDTEEGKLYCINTAIKIYHECEYKELINAFFKYRILLPYFQNSDSKGLMEILSKWNSPKEILLASLRYDLKTGIIMPKISVIIPVYNAEKYLEKCLDSVCNQTLKDIEIICIDDCSTDNSLTILKDYARKDTRIKIIEFAENKGVSIARNVGINTAQGKYIGFVDSDDYIDLSFYEVLLRNAEREKADISKGAFNIISGKYSGKTNINHKARKNKSYFHGEFCTAIYDRFFLEKYNLKFKEHISSWEDPLFIINVVHKSQKIVYDESIFYNYIRHENSKSHVNTFEIMNDRFNAVLNILKTARNEQEYIIYLNELILTIFFITMNNTKDQSLLEYSNKKMQEILLLNPEYTFERNLEKLRSDFKFKQMKSMMQSIRNTK